VTEPVLLAFEDRQYTRSQLDALTSGMATTLEQRGVRSGDRVAPMTSNRPEFVIAMRAIWGLGAAVVLVSSSWKRGEVEHASDALFVFSSGTTGMPKAVRHTHGAFAAAVAQWRAALGMSSADRMPIMTPPSHILGLLNIATAFGAGAWIRLHPRFDVDTMLGHIESDRITIEMAVAPIALALAAHPRLESYDLSSLRYVMWCATVVTKSVADEVTKRVGVSWVTAYNASELPVISCNSLEGARLDTVGRAVPGVQIRIVSLETGQPVRQGEDGEIQVLSRSAMAGYLPDDATASAFSDGWYRTGDVGHLGGDGWLRITDRAKEMIKVRGFQVEADELIALVADRLASYERPSRVVFVPEIPRLPSGKVLGRVVKEQQWTSV
jgi:long-chain acyl-CoA synthetase